MLKIPNEAAWKFWRNVSLSFLIPQRRGISSGLSLEMLLISDTLKNLKFFSPCHVFLFNLTLH